MKKQMKKASSAPSQVTASHDVEAPDLFPLEVPGLVVAAVHDSIAFNDKILAAELPDRVEYKAKHPQGPSRKDDNGLELSCPPRGSPASPPMATGTEEPNTESIPEAVSTSRQPGAQHVNGILQTTVSSNNIDTDASISSQQQNETQDHFVATLVEPAPIAVFISDAELQAAYRLRCRKLPWCKLLWTGGVIVAVIIVTVVAVILTRPDPDTPKQILEALNPFLPESSKEAIQIADTPQFQAFEWLKARGRVGSLSDDRVRRLFTLVSLYHATNGSQWKHQNGWLTNDDECSWYSSNGTGMCDTRVLTNLGLDDNNLWGSLPEDIVLLSSLTLLSLNDNKMTGTIPISLSQLTSLIDLSLEDNSFTGTIPSSLGQLTSLSVLSLYNNSLTGTIPSSLGQLTSLIALSLSFNSLNGTIPSLLGQLTILYDITLAGNTLTGTIPFSLGQLTSLGWLNLQSNALNGTIPASLGQLKNLYALLLDENALTGTIPSSLGQLASFDALTMRGNMLTGTIPFSLGQLASLTRLDLASNTLNGTIPSSLGQLTNLHSLQLNENELTGTIPSSLGQITMLFFMDLHNNSLNGTIPLEICAMENGAKVYLDCLKVACDCENCECW